MKQKLLILCAVIWLTGISLASAAFAAPADAQNAIEKIEYVQPTLENMSKILFRLNILSTDDTAAVDEFVRIQQCGLFKEYGMNAVSWSRIRDAQARTIDLEKPSYPYAIQVVSGLPVEAYDLEKAVFPINDASALSDVGSISVYSSTIGQIYPCKNSNFAFVPRMHPLEISLSLAKPINLLSISATPDLADRYAEHAKKQGLELNKFSLVLRFRILGPNPLATNTHARLSMSLRAELDEIKVYDGPDRKMLIYEQSFKPQKLKK